MKDSTAEKIENGFMWVVIALFGGFLIFLVVTFVQWSFDSADAAKEQIRCETIGMDYVDQFDKCSNGEGFAEVPGR